MISGPSSRSYGHEVHAAPVVFFASFQDPAVSVRAAVGRKQGGVDVEHAPEVGSDHDFGQDAHVAGQADQLDAAFLQGRERFFLPGQLPVGVADDQRLDAGRSRAIQPVRLRFVTDNTANFSIDAALVHRIDQGLQVCSLAGEQDRHRNHEGVVYKVF